MNKDELIIYTDGSFSSADKISSLSFTYFTNSHPENIRFFSASKNTNYTDDNNLIEGEAIKKALEHINPDKYEKIKIYTDSQNVLDRLVIKPEKYNEPFFNEMKHLIPFHCELNWVKGHSKNYHNFVVDLLCKLAREENKKNKEINNDYIVCEKFYTQEFFLKFKPHMKDKKMLSMLIKSFFS